MGRLWYWLHRERSVPKADADKRAEQDLKDKGRWWKGSLEQQQKAGCKSQPKRKSYCYEGRQGHNHRQGGRPGTSV